jgi:hypothetical protein
MFDDATARELMRLRRQFDEAELAAIREFDAAMGDQKANIAVPIDRYRNQAAPTSVTNHRWTEEQKHRSAKAWPVRERKVNDAEASLSNGTTALLRPFGYKEAGLPSIRRRKWVGPAAYAFNSSVTPESRALMQELRRLWVVSGRGGN